MVILGYAFGLLVVAAVVFAVAAVVFGRGEDTPPLETGSTPTMLPEQDVDGTDVRALRFQQVVRGYKPAEVDWALSRLATQIDDLRAELAAGTVTGAAAGGAAGAEEGADTVVLAKEDNAGNEPDGAPEEPDEPGEPGR